MRRSMVSLVLLIGVLGGVGIASLTGARETQSSYATLLARSNPSAMSFVLDASVSTSKFDRLPGVRHVEAVEYSLNALAMAPSGAP
jgi:hypothetical protein